MHEEALYHTILLSLFGSLKQALVAVVVVWGNPRLHPAGSIVTVLLGTVFHKCLNLTAAYRDVDYTHTHLFRQVFNHGTSKIVNRSQTGILAAERRNSQIPLTPGAAQTGVVNGGHHEPAVTYTFTVLVLNTGGALHIGLPKCKINIKILVRLPRFGLQAVL